MPLDHHRLRYYPIPTIRQSYGERDVIIYALGVGASLEDPLADSTLRLVRETNLVTLPTFACVLGIAETWENDAAIGATRSHAVHGDLRLTIHKPLPVAATVESEARIDHVIDKGPGRGALVYMSRRLHDVANGDLLATVRCGYFLRADGGFGGTTEGGPVPHTLPVDRAPDMMLDLPTRPDQASIYRLSGDLFTLHSDAAFARTAGFPKPVLHGLCTYGIVARALIRLIGSDDPAKLRQLDARFSSPVFPGETNRTEVWRERDDRVAFRARVPKRDVIVVQNGLAEFF